MTEHGDLLTGKQHHRNTTPVKDILKGRRRQRETNLQEENDTTGIQHHRKLTSQEKDLSGKHPHMKTSSQEDFRS